MTSSDLPVPAAPTPLTDEQKAAIHGRNQLVSFPGEDRAPAFEEVHSGPSSSEYCDGRGCIFDGDRYWCDGGCPTPPAFETRPPWSDPNDELTAVQYGGAFSVVTGHRLPLTAMALLTPGDPALPGYPSLDADIAAVRSGIHPPYEWSPL